MKSYSNLPFHLKKGKVEVIQSCLGLCDPMEQFIEFSRPEYWSGQPFPSPGDLPDPGIKPRFPTWQADSLPAEPPGKPIDYSVFNLSVCKKRKINYSVVFSFSICINNLVINIIVLVNSGCHNKITQSGWLEQQKCISHNSRGQKVQDQDASQLCFPQRFFLAYRGCLLTVPSHGRKRERKRPISIFLFF